MATSTGPRARAPTAHRGSEDLMVVPYEGDGGSWDRFVAGAEGGTAWHLHGWRAILEDVLGHATRYLLATDARGRWEGALPLARIDGVFGRYLLSMPFLSGGGPLGTPPARWTLGEAARERAVEEEVDLLELRARVPMATPLQVSSRERTLLLDLPGDVDALRDARSDELRASVARARREGREVRFGREQLGAFYAAYAVHMRDLGTPVLPREFFEAVAGTFGARVRFGVVRADGDPVAAACGLVWNGGFDLGWSAFLDGDHGGAGDLLLAFFTERLVREGEARTFGFGLRPPGPGTRRAARRWGAEDVPLPWLQWRPATRPAPDRPLFRAATWLWRHLPVPVTNRLGPPLAGTRP